MQLEAPQKQASATEKFLDTTDKRAASTSIPYEAAAAIAGLFVCNR